MARFRVNQEVVCVQADWFDAVTFNSTPYGPMVGEIITVAGYNTFNGFLFCRFKEYPDLADDGDFYYYHEDNFEPVADITEMKAMLKQEEIEF